MFTVRQRLIFPLLITISIVFCLVAAALQDGYENPIQTRDTKGNPLGFNDPITLELYGILFKSASISGITNKLGWYGLMYVLFHFAALVLFIINFKLDAWKALGSCFLLQIFLFPTGILGLFLLPFYMLFFLGGSVDGESITDFNFPFWYLFQSLWIITSISAGIMIWKRGIERMKLQNHRDSIA